MLNEIFNDSIDYSQAKTGESPPSVLITALDVSCTFDEEGIAFAFRNAFRGAVSTLMPLTSKILSRVNSCVHISKHKPSETPL